jgi:hypothetical protein
MKALAILAAVFFTAPCFALSIPKMPAAVNLVSENVGDIDLASDCKIVRAEEPRGTLVYRVKRAEGVKTVKRPIYGDLCEHITAQFISRIYTHLSDGERSPVIGFEGSNSDQQAVSFPVFSGHVLRAE